MSEPVRVHLRVPGTAPMPDLVRFIQAIEAAGFDSIAGKDPDELFHDLVEMRNRPVEGIMDRQARGYTDEQLRSIADYLSMQPGGGE